jgi:ubiquinone/menaquinone biosynthesis C-methylase UbiE
MATYRPVQGWEDQEGPITLRKIGVNEGDTVLDFGSRIGRYVIPAAVVVGSHGKVYALDRNEKALQVLERKAGEDGLDNVIPVLTDGGLQLGFQDQTVDFVMVYDVLHHVPRPSRSTLLQELRRVLKDDGTLSIMPFYIEGFRDHDGNPEYTIQQLIDEILEVGYTLHKELPGAGVHFACDGTQWKRSGPVSLDDLERGTIWDLHKA